MRNTVRIVTVVALTICGLVFSNEARAQFRTEAFQQSYNDDTAPSDSIDKLFTFKEFFDGISHKDTIRIGTMMGGSTVFIGCSQMYNKQYWKLPIVYGGIGAGIAGGIINRKKGEIVRSNLCFLGAGLVYWATLLDGVISYKTDVYPLPGKATTYSILVPGLGQAYNHEYWKIPIYDGLILTGGYFIGYFNSEYTRYRNLYIEGTKNDALYYRNKFRRYRDYAIVATAAVYLLQIIDANVFSYMHDFNVSDDISLSVSPAVIPTSNQYAFTGNGAAYGLGLNIRF